MYPIKTKQHIKTYTLNTSKSVDVVIKVFLKGPQGITGVSCGRQKVPKYNCIWEERGFVQCSGKWLDNLVLRRLQSRSLSTGVCRQQKWLCKP